MSMTLVNLRWHGKAPTLSELEVQFDLDPAKVDHRFGLVEIDPDDHLFAMRVESDQAAKLRLTAAEAFEGTFADEEIAAF